MNEFYSLNKCIYLKSKETETLEIRIASARVYKKTAFVTGLSMRKTNCVRCSQGLRREKETYRAVQRQAYTG